MNETEMREAIVRIIADRIPGREEILRVIESGIENAMPSSNEIFNAIHFGVQDIPVVVPPPPPK